jgi:D-hydroxyproline dehydrogenase
MGAARAPALQGRRVAVIGAGAIGAAAAVRLIQAGAQVTIVDPGEDRGRAWGNATLICPELVEPLASWKTVREAPARLFALGGPLDFVWRDAVAWLPWTARYLAACGSERFQAGTQALDSLLTGTVEAWRDLLESVGRPDLFQPVAHWGVWETPETLRRGLKATPSTSGVRVRELASQELEAARREVSPRLHGGVAYEGSAKIADPGEAVRALHAAAGSAGGEIIRGHVQHLSLEGGRARLLLNDGRTTEADLVLISAGARSAPLVRAGGLTAPLLAERGYHLQYAEHELAPNVPPMILEDRWICVVRAGQAVRVTGFTEIGRPNSPPDPRKWARLERHVRELALPVRGEPDRWMGARPTLPDFLPAIGRKGRVLYAFGHQHIGLTLAAVTAEAVVELAAGDVAPERLRPFRLERFG